MHKTSKLYKTLLENPDSEKEIKLNIAGTEYTMYRIVSVTTSGGIFSKPDIGCCTSRQIDLTVYPLGTIPRQARIRVYVRLKYRQQVSEWIPKGVFFISTRKTDRRTGALTIHGFDAMLKANTYWLTADYPLGYLPVTQREAAEDIAARMGVQIDPRTVLTEEFPVDYPEVGNEGVTMMEILGQIAVSNGGNWVMTDEGKLLLIRFGDIPADTNYLVTEHGEPITFGGVRILVG